MSEITGFVKLIKYSRQPWMAEAACRGLDVQLFFPERGELTDQARAVCARCPVRQQCLDMALDNPEREGIWGGESARSRRKIRRSRRRP